MRDSTAVKREVEAAGVKVLRARRDAAGFIQLTIRQEDVPRLPRRPLRVEPTYAMFGPPPPGRVWVYFAA